MRGLVHIYCGDRKGGTTMAIGSAVHAAGGGMRVLIARFLKTDNSGEVLALAHVPRITLLLCDQNLGFSWKMTSAQKQAASIYYRDNFYKAWEMAVGQNGEGGFGILVLDGTVGACNLGFVDEDLVLDSIHHRPKCMEVVLTGRGPSEYIEKCSDYITGMVMCRYPFERGIGAREGAEY